MLHRNRKTAAGAQFSEVSGCGPLIPSDNSATRPLRQQVFDYVRGQGLSARVDIAHSLGVSPASVTATTTDLIDAGFIQEIASNTREGEVVRGRPPVLLGVCADAFYVAGIKINDNHHTAVIVDFAGNLIGDASIPHDPNSRSSEGILKETESVLNAVLEKCELDREQLSAIGLGVPGLVDTASGTIIWSPLFSERGLALSKLASERLGLPVFVDNDANLVTMAELWFGKGRSVSDFAVVTIEHGIGMGVVINHEIYRGANGFGMELGHTKVQLDGALCRCGQRGCLEAYVADYALVREASTALSFHPDQLPDSAAMLQHLFEEAKNGHEAAKTIFNRAGRYLAAGLANVVNLFDPSMVILAGERMQYDFLYADEVLEEMKKLVLDWQRTQPKIEIHAWGDLLWAHGAAALALSEFTESHINVTNLVATN